MDAVNDPTVREIWVMKSAQVGWTEILNNVVGYFVDQDASPILLVQPTLEMAEAWSKDRLAPMIRDTPCLRDRIADPKARDSGNTLLHKKFSGGHLTIAGANSPAGLASRPIRVVLFDEVDRFPASAGAEGDPISLGKKRSTTFWNRKMLAGSTPTVKGSSRIEAGFEQGDQRYYVVPCTHCGEFQRLVWGQVRWPEGRPEQAAYICKHCGVELRDADKAAMLRSGEWRATKPFNGIASFHISEIYSPWVTWPEMAISFLEAKKLPETLQTWINTALGETWEEKGSGVETGSLIDRCEPYTPDAIPAGVLLPTMGVDVQDDRIECFVYGWGADEESWFIEHKVLRGDPGQSAIWDELDHYRRRVWCLEDGRRLMVEATAIDSGGHFTQQVYRYAAKRKAQRVWAIKGMAGAGRLAWPKHAKRATGKTRANVFIVGVDTIKSLLYGRLKLEGPGPGYLHFPSACDKTFFDQITSEVEMVKVLQGRRVRFWKPRSSGVRQEALDGTVYAYAALVGRGLEILARRARSGGGQGQSPVEEATEKSIASVAEAVRPVERAPTASKSDRIVSSWVGKRNGWFRR